MKENITYFDEWQNRSLLQSKLSPPLSGRSLVSRSRLDKWLHAAESARLILINAPAGFGKTTLLAQWFKQLQLQGEATAWLTIDEADNDPGRFLTYLVLAIQKCVPDIDVTLPKKTELLGNRVHSGVILWLLDKLSTFQPAFFLFLDDFGKIQNPEVLAVVQQLIHHLPSGKKVIMSQRRVPELGLGRIRAQGELVEIDAEELRFTIEETDQFVRKSQNNDLDQRDVQFLQNFTEGWVAGIQLSTLSPIWRNKIGDGMPTSTGAFGKISSYLAEDVLARQPEEIQAFLMQTSILTRLSGPLCDALTGRTDGYEILDYLERANLFLVPLDEERHWYRYHSLFAKFLRNRLERRGRDHLNILHRIASHWCEKEKEFQEAAQHALASGDITYAADLMERCAMAVVLSGQMVTIVEWGGLLPPEVLESHPALQLAYCYALIFRREYEKASKILEDIDQNEHRKDSVSMKDELLPLRALLLIGQDKISDYEQAVTDGLEKYVEAKLGDQGKLTINTSMMHVAGAMKISEGKFDDALAYLGRAAALTRRIEMHHVGRLYNKYLVACLELTQGRLHDALEIVRSALSSSSGLAQYSAGGMAAAILQAEVLYEINQLEKAEQLITQFRSLLPTSIPPDIMIVGLRTLTRIYSARGDESKAMHCIAELERLGAERAIPRAVASAHLEEIRIALQHGDVERAIQVTRDHNDRSIWQQFEGRCMLANDPETPEISKLRLMIAKGQGKEALEQLKTAVKIAESSGRVRQVVLIHILIAKAYESCGERKPALRALRDALLAGQSGGFVRSFLDEGELVTLLLRELCDKNSIDDATLCNNISPDYFKLFFNFLGDLQSRKATQLIAQDSFPLEELTDREIAILEKLATGLSNDNIADQLYISKHTVRFHLRNINSKLGANNRTQAVAIARQLGLIS